VRSVRRSLALVVALGAVLLAVGVVPAAAAPADAGRLTYLVGIDGDSPVVWGAHADGSGRVRLAVGADQAKISPDGGTVALDEPDGSGSSLVIAPSGDPAGTAPPARRLLRAKEDLILLAWSADGSELAVEADDRLVVVDVASGAKHVIARGLGFEASFSPSGRQLVYAHSIIVRFAAHVASLGSGPSCSNLFVANVDGSGRRALTHDGLASNPLWGPSEIAFSRTRKCSRRGGGGFFPAQLWLMEPDGHGVHRLTHVDPGPASLGLSPTAWSDDGRRLLADLDTPSGTGAIPARDGAWTVEVPSGRARQLRVRGSTVRDAALSHDGSTVLATLISVAGSFRFPFAPSRSAVVTIPWRGGAPHVLVRPASSPSWTR
jgi:hypothetical protein